jgi:nitrogen fixation NifU-like protein
MSMPHISPAGTAERHALYRNLVLDHARAPRNFGRLEDATHRAEGINSLCGDKLELMLAIRPDGRIAKAQFVGAGCAISLASASILTEMVTGLSTAEAQAMVVSFRQSLESEDEADQHDLSETLHALAGVRDFPSRIKCATLAWHALSSAVNGRDAGVVTTE